MYNGGHEYLIFFFLFSLNKTNMDYGCNANKYRYDTRLEFSYIFADMDEKPIENLKIKIIKPFFNEEF